MRLRTTHKATLLAASAMTGISTTTADDAGGGAGGGGAGGPNGAGADGGGETRPYYEGFKNEALRTNASVHRFADVEALADGYVNLEKRFGIDPNRRLDLPADPNDADGMRQVWSKLGLPEKADGYGFKLDDKASDADKAMLSAFTEHAHKAGMPAVFAQSAMAFWQGKVAEANQAQEQAYAQRLTDGKGVLQKEWGGAFAAREGEVRRLITQHMGPEFAKDMEGDKLYAYPKLIAGLGKIVERMAEPGNAGGEQDGRVEAAALTPAQAKAKAREVEAHPGFRDASHPQHKALVEQRNKLLQQAEA